MADYEDLPSPLMPPDSPTRAGMGTFLGMTPADFAAILGGLLQGVPLGRGPVSNQIHPFNALFPLAQGLANSDSRARQDQVVKDLTAQYGGQDIPEFQSAINLLRQGDPFGHRLLAQGVTDAKQRQRDALRVQREGQSAEAWGQAQRPVTEPGMTSARPLGPGELLAPPPAAPVENFQDVNRAPDVREIIGRLNAIADPGVRQGAFKMGDQTIAARNLEDVKLRPKTVVKDQQFIREDPRRGTASVIGELPETTAQAAVRRLREARTTKEEALTARAQRDPNAPPGSEMNPHIWHEKGEPSAGGPRQVFEIRSFTRANKDAPNGVEHVTQQRPVGINAPWKPYAPKGEGGGGTKETLETTDKVTPRRQIRDDATFKALQGGVQDVVNDVTNKFKGQGLDFNTPGSYVKLPSGQQVRKEDVLAKAFKARHGVDATLVWRNGQFFLTQAWAPETREPMEKRRIVGPAGTIKANTPQSSSDDEEE